MGRTLAVAMTVLAVLVPFAAASDPSAAVEAFVRRIAGADVRDLVVDQDVTLYHADGVHVRARGSERLYMRPPGRQRQEQVIDGRREVRLVVDGRAWVRDHTGAVSEAPPNPDRRMTGVLVPGHRSTPELLADWKGLGIRDDVSHVVRIGHRAVTVIGAREGERETPTVWLDPEHGVVRLVSRERLPERSSWVDVSLSEHRPLLGPRSFPWRQEVFVDGKLILLVVVRSARANVGVPDTLFDPAALGRAP